MGRLKFILINHFWKSREDSSYLKRKKLFSIFKVHRDSLSSFETSKCLEKSRERNQVWRAHRWIDVTSNTASRCVPHARGQLSCWVPWGQADNWGGEEGGSRGRGGELQCRGTATEDVMAQASDRRETMVYSHNVNGDFEFAYCRGETLAGVTQLNTRFISTGHPAGQETQNLHPLIWLLCPQISRNVPDVQPLALFLCCDPRHELFSSPISRHVRTCSLMPPKAGLYQCPTTRRPGSTEHGALLPAALTPASRRRCPSETCLETPPSPSWGFGDYQPFFCYFC